MSPSTTPTHAHTQRPAPKARGTKTCTPDIHPVARAYLDLHAAFQATPRRAIPHGIECVHRSGQNIAISPLVANFQASFWTTPASGHAALQHAQILLSLQTAFLAFVESVHATPAFARMAQRLSVRFIRGGTGIRGVARTAIEWGDMSGDVADAPGGSTLVRAFPYDHTTDALAMAQALDAAARTSGPVRLHACVSDINRQPHAAWAATDTLAALAPTLCPPEDNPSLWTHAARMPVQPALQETTVPTTVEAAHDALFAVAASRAHLTGDHTPVFLLRTGARSCTTADRTRHTWMEPLEHLWEAFWDAMETWIPGIAHRDVPGVHTLHLPSSSGKVTPISFYGIHTPKRTPTDALRGVMSPLASIAHGRLWGSSTWGASGPWYAPGMTVEDAGRAASHLHTYNRKYVGFYQDISTNRSFVIGAPKIQHIDVWEPAR